MCYSIALRPATGTQCTAVRTHPDLYRAAGSCTNLLRQGGVSPVAMHGMGGRKRVVDLIEKILFSASFFFLILDVVCSTYFFTRVTTLMGSFWILCDQKQVKTQ